MRTGTGHSRPYLLLTGATGLVGGLVLARLLSCGLSVAVLVRGNRRLSAAERIESLMRRLEERFGRLFVRPVVLTGDLCTPGLGLSETTRQWISDNCDSVIHSAANLLFRPASEHPDNEPYRTNVDGTRTLLEVLSNAGITEWHYVSTAYIAGMRSGRILESESNVGQEFGNDYERSKTISEQMLRESPAIHSLTVYRPSIVIDLHPTTSMRSDQTINSAFLMFQALSQRFGLPERGDWFRRLGFSGHERKNIVTVDWVATMIAQIYRRPALHEKTYHLTSPTGTSAAELEDGFRTAVLEGGVKLPPRRAEATALIDEQAAPFVAAFKPYFKDDPKFDRANTAWAMDVCGESDLPVLTIEKLRDFCMRQTKPTPPGVAIRGDATAWERFVVGIGHSSLTRPIAENCGPWIGGEILGPGGGQWLVQETTNGWIVLVGNAGSAPSRFIGASTTFNRMIDGQLSVSAAIESGLLRLEVETGDDGFPSAASLSQLTEQLNRLIAGVQNASSDHCLRSEVAYVR